MLPNSGEPPAMTMLLPLLLALLPALPAKLLLLTMLLLPLLLLLLSLLLVLALPPRNTKVPLAMLPPGRVEALMLTIAGPTGSGPASTHAISSSACTMLASVGGARHTAVTMRGTAPPDSSGSIATDTRISGFCPSVEKPAPAKVSMEPPV